MSGYGNPKAEFRRQREALFALDAQTTPGLRRVRQQLRAMATLVEGVLCALWARQAALEPCALLAVGGLGRGELFPHSDIDVLVLLPEGARPDSDARLRKGIEDFITSCWDAGLEIGSSVRTVAQCLEASAADVSVQTALLEARHLAGPKALAATLMQQFGAAMDAKAFFIAKTLEMRQRHVKYEDTPYALEPNCKESPGGLRDLQVILWVTRAAGYGSSWEDLARNGLATRLEARNLRRCEELLGLVRIQLHLMAGRREDRLLFDLQTQVAHSLGYWPEPDAFDEEDVQAAQRRRGRSQLPGERLMRRYYWTAKGVRQLNQILLLNIEERLGGRSTAVEPINERFADRSGMLEVASDDLYLKNPQAILETFLLYETSHPKLWDLSVRTLRALYNARHVMDAAFRRDPVNRQTFMKILQQPAGITHALRLMNQTSVLGRYLPAFRRIVGRMQHDLFHVYTVDQHILMVVRNIRRFFIAEHAHEYPLCSAIASELEKPWRLYLAALFHDIAKGRGGDHSLLGAADALRFCRRHEVAADDTEFITFLVREHLLMSTVAQKSDISDPAVIAGFARRVGTEQRLNALYLLTVADIRGTSPRVWNAWKGKLLEDLYHITLRVLGGNSPDAGAEVQMRRQEALRLLALAGQAGDAHEPLWETLDVGYFMHHDAGDIAWHTRELAGHVGCNATIVRARVSPVSGEGLQVMVYTPRLQALFARCSGYFERSGYSIVEAQIHTTASQYALNTFHVVAPALADRYRDCIGMIENDLARDIERAGPLPAPVHGRVSRRVRSFPVTPRVKLTPDEKGSHWVLSVSASDRPGLLYSIARVLAGHGLSVLMARIATLGERVEDTFLIEGDELRHNRAQIALETELLWTIADG